MQQSNKHFIRKSDEMNKENTCASADVQHSFTWLTLHTARVCVFVFLVVSFENSLLIFLFFREPTRKLKKNK